MGSIRTLIILLVRSIDSQSNVVDVMLGIIKGKKYNKCHQNSGKQLQPRLIAALEGL